MAAPTHRRSEPRRSRFGAAVPDRFETWRPDRPTGRSARRRSRTDRADWRSQEIAEEVVAEIARQAAARREARQQSRSRLAGRMRLTRPRPPAWLELWRGLRLPVRLISVGIPAVLLAGLVLLNLPFLKVQRVEVEGSPVVSRAQLLSEAGVRIGQSTLVLNSRRMTAALLAQPWVSSAAVRVRWPGTLLVSVSALPPVLVYDRGSHKELLAATGAVLGPVPAGPALRALPVLEDLRSGAGAAAGSLALPAHLTAALAALNSAFPAAYGVTVKDYVITRVGALEIQSSAGWTADLGPALTAAQVSALGPKLEALRALAAKVNLKSTAIKDIYLEDPGQAVVSP